MSKRNYYYYKYEQMTLDNIKEFYPQAEDIKMEYHSLNEKERHHITKWVLHQGMKMCFAISFVPVVGVLTLLFLSITDIWKIENGVSDTCYVAMLGVFAFLFLLMWFRNKRELSAIDFNKVQEVVYIKCSGREGRPKITAWQWDEGKQIFCKGEMISLVDVKGKEGDIMYHPYGVNRYIPGPKKTHNTNVQDKEYESLDYLDDMGAEYEIVQTPISNVFIPEGMKGFYDQLVNARLPFGRIYSAKEALKMSRREPFEPEWFVFGQGNDSSYWLCKREPDAKGRQFTYLNNSDKSDINEPVWDTLFAFLKGMEEMFESYDES